MGVTGLWKLIDASGKPVPLETLENKVLAIDISIWLHQVVKGYQDNKGGHLPNAHLLGLFNRICKLLYFRIKPVFIFDGGIPSLKRETIAKRLQSKSKIRNEADKFEQLLLESLAKEKIVKQALGGAVSQLLSPRKKSVKPKKDEKEDIFKLPPLKEEHDANIKNEEENCPKNAYDVNINTIDVTSSHFKSLPPDIRHDILTDIKETRKQSTWGRLRELPVEGNDFSTYQMSRLIRRRQVQTGLEDAEKEMGGKTWSLSELESLLSEDGVIQAASTNHAQRIASDEQTRFLLVRDISKAIENAKNINTEETAPEKSTETTKLNPHPSTSKKSIFPATDDLRDEFDLDVQRAIQLSLGGIDQEFLDDNKTCTRIKLNPKQRKVLSGTLHTHGLVRGYMMEYAEMNDTDIHALFDVTQDSKEVEVVDEYRAKFPNNDEYVLYGTPKKSKPIQIEEQKDAFVIGVISDSDSDSNLEEVTSGKSSKDLKKDSNVNVQMDAAKIGVISDSDSNLDLEDVSIGEFLKDLKQDSNASVQKDAVEIGVISDSDSDSNLEEVTIGKLLKDLKQDSNASVQKNAVEIGVISDSDSDSNLEEVTIGKLLKDLKKDSNASAQNETVEIGVISDSDSDTNLEKVSCGKLLKDLKKDPNVCVQITVASDLKNYIQEEDLFADIFKNDAVVDCSKNSVYEFSLKMVDKDTIPDVVDFISSPDSSHGTLPYDYSEMELIGDSDFINEEVSKYHEYEKKVEDTSETNEKNEIHFEMTEVEEILEKPKKADIVNSIETIDVIHEDMLNSPSKNTPTKSTILSTSTKSGSVTKDLFPGISPQKAKQNLQAEIEKAVAALRAKKTESELRDMVTELVQEQKSLVKERNKQDRMGTSITNNMSRECKELLKLFGIPYVDSPMEAEAQCAFLNMVKLTDGTISDDSDIWLFGGQTVYKNFFVQKKMVMEFQFENIEKMFNLDRKKLIQLAMLVGSDYTTGINGVGAVTALEILAAFPITPVVPGETSEYQSMISSLRKFRDWFNNGKPVGTLGKTVLKNKLKNVELFEGFPNLNVARAYLEPVIDNNKENFSWGLPDTESLVEFAKMKLGWTRSKTDEILEPVMKRLNEKKQSTMKDYFKSQVTKKYFDSGTMSRRVQKAVEKMAGYVSGDENKKKEKNSRKRGIKGKKKAVEDTESFKIPDEDQNIMLVLSDEDEMDMQPPAKSSKTPEKPDACTKTKKALKRASVKKSAPRKRKQNEVEDDPKPSTSKGTSSCTRKTPRIPNTKQVIPQREKDKEEQEKAKQKAIEMFKKSKPSAVKKN